MTMLDAMSAEAADLYRLRLSLGVTDDEWANLMAEATGVLDPTFEWLRVTLADPARPWHNRHGGGSTMGARLMLHTLREARADAKRRIGDLEADLERRCGLPCGYCESCDMPLFSGDGIASCGDGSITCDTWKNPASTCYDPHQTHPPGGRDPVHFDAERCKWFFWDETWAHRDGPYDTELVARVALKDYVSHMLEGDATDA